ncbi:MAG: TDT family transporter [Methanomassiliicoccaceae archaeon]|nr:TDT family transporter [Methanomassiliicoccaceae archaeon]
MGLKEFISKIPVPICGLSLGLASLDSFLFKYYQELYPLRIGMILAVLIVTLFTIRLMIDRKGVAKDIETPALFGVLPTYTMSLMLIAASVHEFIGIVATGLWIMAIIASYVFMVFFIKNCFLRFDMMKVFPSWIIIFVGYVVASNTAPVFGMEPLGQILFWSGFAGYFAVIPVIFYRTVVVRKYPEHMVPTIAIFAAPVNLCIVGCLRSFSYVPPEIPLMILMILGVISYTIVVAYLPVMLNRKFYPTFAGMTFPLVISAVAFYELGYMYYDLSSNLLFEILQTITVLIAVLIVVYVFIRYVMFLYRTAEDSRTVKQT